MWNLPEFVQFNIPQCKPETLPTILNKELKIDVWYFRPRNLPNSSKMDVKNSNVFDEETSSERFARKFQEAPLVPIGTVLIKCINYKYLIM